MGKYISENFKDRVAKSSLKLFMAAALTMGYIMIQIGEAKRSKERY